MYPRAAESAAGSSGMEVVDIVVAIVSIFVGELFRRGAAARGVKFMPRTQADR